MGGKIEVDTFSGKLNVVVPRGSQNGSKLRIRGKGMPVFGSPGTNGDLYVQLNVIIPRNLKPEETKLFGKLKELRKTKGNL